MGYFSVKVVYSNGSPAKDIGVMINYGLFNGQDEKRTDRNGWVEFHNHGDRSGTIYVHGERMGSHSLANGKTYSFTI
jgi:hypothetical protein